jgi:hypothetical protein
LAFGLFAVLAVLAVFVLDGAAAGVSALAAMLVFILACIEALRHEDADTRRRNDRSALAGWCGGYF